MAHGSTDNISIADVTTIRAGRDSDKARRNAGGGMGLGGGGAVGVCLTLSFLRVILPSLTDSGSSSQYMFNFFVVV